MTHLFHGLRELFRYKAPTPAAVASTITMGQSPSSSKERAKAGQPSYIVEPQVEVSDTRIVAFMSNHYQHCIMHEKQSTKPSSSSEAFTLFPLLPPEIRVKIWEAAAAEPHTVELSCTPVVASIPQGRWFSHSKPPTIFHVNAESRAVALREFSVLTFSPGQIGLPPGIIYINFSSGCLWLCADLAAEWARNLLEKSEQLKVGLKFLVVNRQLWNGLNPVTVIPPGTPAIMSKWETSSNVSGALKALEVVRFHS
jgi:hypothetical protein